MSTVFFLHFAAKLFVCLWVAFCACRLLHFVCLFCLLVCTKTSPKEWGRVLQMRSRCKLARARTQAKENKRKQNKTHAKSTQLKVKESFRRQSDANWRPFFNAFHSTLATAVAKVSKQRAWRAALSSPVARGEGPGR